MLFPSIANALSSTYRTDKSVIIIESESIFKRDDLNTGRRGVSPTEAEPFGKDEGIDLSAEAGGHIFNNASG